MKKLLTMMTVCCMLMLSGCSKSDDGGTDTPQVTDPTTQAGTWAYQNEIMEDAVAMTFDGHNHVLIKLNKVWFYGTMQRSSGHLTMTGSQIQMDEFTDYGTYQATTLPLQLTINCDYGMKGELLHISNISTTPDLRLKLYSGYGLSYRGVFKGTGVIN